MSEIDTEQPARPMIEEVELTLLDVKGELVPYDEQLLFAPKTTPLWRKWHDFPILVLLPIALGVVYLFLIVSDRYVSEMKYVVRSGGGSSLAGVASLVQTQGLSRAADETYVVNEYIKSRDMVRKLAVSNGLRDIMNRPEADPITRFPNFYSRDDFEQLYRHFQNVVDISLDEAAGISTLRATAYRPADAKALVIAVMGYAEALINTLNDRAHDDAMRYAQMIVDKARVQAAEVEARLTVFRNGHGTVNPAQETVAALEMIGRFSEQLAKLEATLIRQTALTPTNPGNDALRQKIQSYKDEIKKLQSSVVGTNTSTTMSLAAYESLTLERTLASKSLEAALLNFERTREEAQQKHLYIETIAEPNMSDIPEYPRRVLDLFIVASVSVGVWLIIRSLRISAMEHSV